MSITSVAALWFLPFVLPICLYVCFTDLSQMRITNQAVLALAAVFVIVGLIALPLPVYGMRLAQLFGVLLVGFVLTAAGAMGAGDAKFAAAAAPFIAAGDLRLLLALFAANLLAAFATHRLAKYTPLRRIAPEWKSWGAGRKFPMGLSLGSTLALYLILGAFYGA
ncbi:MAG: prepilin peptidase [Pseudodonghicola sp.]|nr:prepilin peptidase [Pseudodonghicola sp.]